MLPVGSKNILKPADYRCRRAGAEFAVIIEIKRAGIDVFQ